MLIAVEKELVEGLTLALYAQQQASVEVTKVIKELAQQADENQLLTPAQACDYLGGIHENTLLNYRNQGLDHYKKGQSIFFRRGDIDQWLSTGKVVRRGASS